ncbi:MAG: hypothetical protein KDD34_01045 [Bdellovibrionales bacterium]|nr:hypothetical protein [Bdellovibrionales bacterium]
MSLTINSSKSLGTPVAIKTSEYQTNEERLEVFMVLLKIRWFILWFSMSLGAVSYAMGDGNWQDFEKNNSSLKELFYCSLKVTNAYREGYRLRTYVDIKNQPVILGESQDVSDLQTIFTGKPINHIFGNNLAFMASLFKSENNHGQYKIKYGIYQFKVNKGQFTGSEFTPIPNTHYYIVPVVENKLQFQPKDTITMEFHRPIGNNTNASFIDFSCQHAKSIGSRGVK